MNGICPRCATTSFNGRKNVAGRPCAYPECGAICVQEGTTGPDVPRDHLAEAISSALDRARGQIITEMAKTLLSGFPRDEQLRDAVFAEIRRLVRDDAEIREALRKRVLAALER